MSILPEQINGWRKTPRGVYVPTGESVASMLKGMVPIANKLPRYIPQSNELLKIKTARQASMAVLLAGPTGVGKNLLARTIAAEERIPFIVAVMTDDASDYKMRGPQQLVVMPVVDENGAIHELRVQLFSPAPLALAALSERPVLLFIDELHKIRPGVTPLLHGITNKDERMLYCTDLTGETYKLHPDTLVMAALNPSYGEGITRLDAAMRRRWATVPFDMPDTDTIVRIVESNMESYGLKLEGNLRELAKRLAKFQRGIYNALNSTGEDGRIDAETMDSEINSQVTGSIEEAPSPESVFNAVRAVALGLPVLSAVAMYMIDTIVTDFRTTRRALLNIARKKLPEGILHMQGTANEEQGLGQQ